MKCLVCGRSLKHTVCEGKKGRKAIMLSCPEDGRHFRGFINDAGVAKGVAELGLSLEEVLGLRNAENT